MSNQPQSNTDDSDHTTTPDELTEHTWEHGIGDVLSKQIDGSTWKVENRLIDIDHDTPLYRLRDVDSTFNDTETLTANQVTSGFDSKGTDN